MKEQLPGKAKKINLAYFVIIILTYELAQFVFGVFTFMALHGFLSARSIWENEGQILATLLVAAPFVFACLYYLEHRFGNISHYIIIASYLLFMWVLWLAIFNPYGMGSELADPHRSTTVFVVNLQIIYSLTYFLFLGGAFIICIPKQKILKKLILFILPPLFTIIIWVLLISNLPVFRG